MLYRFYVQEHTLAGEKRVPLGRERFFQAIGKDHAEALIRVRAQVNASDLRLPTIRSA